MASVPLEGPNAGWINNALESAIEKYGAPKHIISDQAHVFTGTVFAESLGKYNIKPRLGRTVQIFIAPTIFTFQGHKKLSNFLVTLYRSSKRPAGLWKTGSCKDRNR